MRKSTRALVGAVAINLPLLAGAAWMVAQVKSGAWRTADPGEAIVRITTTFGGVIGLVTGLLLAVFIIRRLQGD